MSEPRPPDEGLWDEATPSEATRDQEDAPGSAADEWSVSPDELLMDLAIPRAPASEPEAAAEAPPDGEPAEPEAESMAAEREAEPEPVEAEPQPDEAEPEAEPVADEPADFTLAAAASTPVGADAAAAERLVPLRPWLRRGAEAWIPTGPGDTATVDVGDTVEPTLVIGQRVRDARVAVVVPRDRARFDAGTRIRPDETTGRGRAGLADEGTVLYRSTRSRVAVVSGREREALYARVDGTVAAVSPGGVAVLVSGPALDGVAGAGEPVHGRLRMGVGDPGDELRSPGLHVADAGSIVVAGARVDVETLTRARALGIHGVITGGIAGHDLRSFQQSEARQQAALHPLPPFALFVLEGFGRRSLAGPPWGLFRAAAGMGVSIFPDPPLLVFAPDADLDSVAPGTVRIVAGPGAGTVGRIDGPALLHRFEEGVRLLAVPFLGGGRRSMVALADLERFQ